MEPKPNWNRTETELNRIESSVWNGNRVALLLTGKTEVKPNRTRTENEVAICPLYSTATNQRAATTVTTQEEETSREDEEHGKRRSNFGILQVSSGFFGFLATFMTISEQKKWRSSKERSQHSHRSWDASRFFKILRWLLRSDQSVKKKPKRNPNKKENQTSNKKKSVINSLKKLQSETVARSGGSVG